MHNAQCTQLYVLLQSLCFIACEVPAWICMHACKHPWVSVFGVLWCGHYFLLCVFLAPIFLFPPSVSLSTRASTSPIIFAESQKFAVEFHHWWGRCTIVALKYGGKKSRAKKFCANGFKNNNNNSIGGSSSTIELLLFIHTRARWLHNTVQRNIECGKESASSRSFTRSLTSACLPVSTRSMFYV